MTEHDEQAAFVEWLEWHGIPVFAIPNGSNKSKAAAAKFKAEGLRAGVPDLMIPVPTDRYAGLFIEMKSDKGTLSKEQKEWLSMLADMRYATAACWGVDEAIKCFKLYDLVGGEFPNLSRWKGGKVTPIVL